MNKIISQTENLVNNFFSKIIETITKNKNWETAYTALSHDFIKNAFVCELEQLDEQFFNSSERKHKFRPKDVRKRTVVTLFGEITIRRRRYVSKSSGTAFYYIDTLLGLQKYERFTSEVKAAMLQELTFEMSSYANVARRFGASKGTVYNIVRKLSFEDFDVNLKDKISCETLHIVADEDHISLQKAKENGSKSHIIKHVTLFTEIKKIGKNRNELVERVTLSPFEKETNQEFCDRISIFILKNYDVKGTIFTYGDGAFWIKTLAETINSTFILDKFHMQQGLVRVAGGKKNKEILEQLQIFLKEDKKKDFFEFVDEKFPPEERSKTKEQNVLYIKNNWSFYQGNFEIPKVLYCCAEGINSHYFARYLSSRPKGFSTKNAHTIANLIGITNSKVELTTTIKKIIIKSEKRKHKEKNKTTAKQETKLPILEYGKTTNLFKTLKSITRT